MKDVERYIALNLANDSSNNYSGSSHYQHNHKHTYFPSVNHDNLNSKANATPSLPPTFDAVAEIKRKRSRLEKFKFLSRSSEDLIKLDSDETNERSEETRLAEEALAANLKLIKKQKAKFLRLQRILSRNVFIIPMCIIFTILSSLSIYAATVTNYYELVTFNITQLQQNINAENIKSLSGLNSFTKLNFSLKDVFSGNRRSELLLEIPKLPAAKTYENSDSSRRVNVSLPKSKILITSTPSTSASSVAMSSPPPLNLLTQLIERHHFLFFYDLSSSETGEYHIVNRVNYLVPDGLYIKKNVIYDTHSGVWRTCNDLKNETLEYLSIERCTLYKRANIQISPFLNNHHTGDESTESDPRRDLIRMHNAAACCTIVCYILLIVTWVTSLASAITKKVPPTLASYVLNSIVVVFNVLLLAIYHRKILAEEKHSDCFDLKILFDVVCSSRIVKFSYSLGLTWLALLFTSLNTVCWFHIAKMQKLLFSNGYY